MSDTESDSEVCATSDACYSIHNQQGDPYLFPPSPEHAYSSVTEVTERTIEEITAWTKHGGHESSETDAGTVTTHDQGTQTDVGAVTTRDQGTQTAADMFQRQYQDKGVQANTEADDSVVVLVVVKKGSKGKNKRKGLCEDCRPAKKERKNS